MGCGSSKVIRVDIISEAPSNKYLERPAADEKSARIHSTTTLAPPATPTPSSAKSSLLPSTRDNVSTAKAPPLPASLLAHIMGFIDDRRELSRMSLVCRNWNALSPAQIELLWR